MFDLLLHHQPISANKHSNISGHAFNNGSMFAKKVVSIANKLAAAAYFTIANSTYGCTAAQDIRVRTGQQCGNTAVGAIELMPIRV
eukprot:15405-Heterococcus_DN1.PRE.2